MIEIEEEIIQEEICDRVEKILDKIKKCESSSEVMSEKHSLKERIDPSFELDEALENFRAYDRCEKSFHSLFSRLDSLSRRLRTNLLIIFREEYVNTLSKNQLENKIFSTLEESHDLMMAMIECTLDGISQLEVLISNDALNEPRSKESSERFLSELDVFKENLIGLIESINEEFSIFEEKLYSFNNFSK